MKLKKFRIVSDKFAGYECQIWRVWWSFWCEIGVNTHGSIEKAKAYIESYRKVYWES